MAFVHVLVPKHNGGKCRMLPNLNAKEINEMEGARTVSDIWR